MNAQRTASSAHWVPALAEAKEMIAALGDGEATDPNVVHAMLLSAAHRSVEIPGGLQTMQFMEWAAQQLTSDEC